MDLLLDIAPVITLHLENIDDQVIFFAGGISGTFCGDDLIFRGTVAMRKVDTWVFRQ